MPQLVKYQYGDTSWGDGQVIDFQYRETANLTKRWYRDTSLSEATLKIELQGCDWGELKTQIDELYTAFSENDRKFAVIDENGDDTRWVIDPASASCMAGPIVNVIECPTGSMEEMVVVRTFIVQIKGLFAAAESEVIYYEDSVTHQGTCGASWVAQPTVNMGVRSYEVWPATTQHIIQEGNSIGFDGYYSPNPLRVGGTIPVLSVDYEHLEKRIDVPIKPQRIRNGFYYYPWKWRYVFESKTDLSFMYPS